MPKQTERILCGDRTLSLAAGGVSCELTQPGRFAGRSLTGIVLAEAGEAEAAAGAVDDVVVALGSDEDIAAPALALPPAASGFGA